MMSRERWASSFQRDRLFPAPPFFLEELARPRHSVLPFLRRWNKKNTCLRHIIVQSLLQVRTHSTGSSVVCRHDDHVSCAISWSSITVSTLFQMFNIYLFSCFSVARVTAQPRRLWARAWSTCSSLVDVRGYGLFFDVCWAAWVLIIHVVYLAGLKLLGTPNTLLVKGKMNQKPRFLRDFLFDPKPKAICLVRRPKGRSFEWPS